MCCWFAPTWILVVEDWRTVLSPTKMSNPPHKRVRYTQHQTPGCQFYAAISWALLRMHLQKLPRGNCFIQHVDPFETFFFLQYRKLFCLSLYILFISLKPPHILAKTESDCKTTLDIIPNIYLGGINVSFNSAQQP